MKFDRRKILTVVTADKAKVGMKGNSVFVLSDYAFNMIFKEEA
jgi:hypothetical protein